MAFLVNVNKNLIQVETTETITSGSSNVYVMKFNFSDEWAPLERVAVFRRDQETPVNILLDDTNQCMIPWEVMTTPDAVITFGVYGTMDGNVVLPTVWANGGIVVEGVITGVELEPPTPDIYQQILAKLSYIENNIGSGGASNVVDRCAWIYAAGNDISIFENGKTNVAAPDEFIGHAPKVSSNNVGLILVDSKLYWATFDITEANENAITQVFTKDPVLVGTVSDASANDGLLTIKDTAISNISQLPTDNLPCCFRLINSFLGFLFIDDIVYVKYEHPFVWVYTINGAICNMRVGSEGQLERDKVDYNATTRYVDEKFNDVGFRYKIGHGLKVTGDELSVDTTSNFDGDNTLPMTAAGVQTTLGNIEILLATI